MHVSENARRVLESRYLRRDAERRIIETPEELINRVAKAVATAELTWGNPTEAEYWHEQFFDLMDRLDFLPNSPTLMNAGTELGQLSACFVLPVEDTIEGIFETIKKMALVQRTGGGTGFSFSRLRPRGDFVASTAASASGPVSFMKIFDCATENIKQGGKRRGANMGILRVDHPDIMEFINAKSDGITLQNFNISVGVTDSFLEAAQKNKPYDLIHPASKKKAGGLNAKQVFEAIVNAAWKTGDPGLIFLDSINRSNPTPQLGDIEATNPCGEIPLLPHEACNLGSINLAHLIRAEGHRHVLDEEKLRNVTHTALRFLDNVIEINRYPTPEFAHACRGNRKIGLGVMGFAEMLIRLGISYDSSEAVKTGDEVMRIIMDEATKTSRFLAEKRGVFPNWKGSMYEKKNLKLRNAALTAIAPTGTISIIANTSASIEPLFALAYRRHVLEGEVLDEVNPLFLNYLKDHKLNPKQILDEIMKTGALSDVPDIPLDAKKLFVTALQIPFERHLQIQVAFQKHVDNSVSKTINMQNRATPDDVAQAYWRAWKWGLKGITIYRYGSKTAQVLELGVDEDPLRHEYTARCDPEECKV